jgi:hypothetical protein
MTNAEHSVIPYELASRFGHRDFIRRLESHRALIYVSPTAMNLREEPATTCAEEPSAMPVLPPDRELAKVQKTLTGALARPNKTGETSEYVVPGDAVLVVRFISGSVRRQAGPVVGGRFNVSLAVNSVVLDVGRFSMPQSETYGNLPLTGILVIAGPADRIVGCFTRSASSPLHSTTLVLGGKLMAAA